MPKKKESTGDKCSFIFLANNNINQENEKWQEILRVGDWSNSYKEFEITKQMLSGMVRNFNKNILRQKVNELQVNYGHNAGNDAAGWITKLRVKGNVLEAKIRFTPSAIEKIKNEDWRYFSAEINSSFQDQETGKKFKNVLTGAGLTNIPFVAGLAPIKLSKSEKENLHFIFKNFTSKNMETFKILLSSLEAKDVVTPSEFGMLKLAMTALDDDEKEEAQEKVDEVKEKVEEKKPADPPDEEDKGGKDPEDKKDKENKEGSENLSKNLAQDLISTKEELSKSHSRIDKLELKLRERDELGRVTKLSQDGKILPKDVDKYVKMLCDEPTAKADKWFAMLEKQPKVVALDSELGSGHGDEGDKTDSLPAKAKEIHLSEMKAMGDKARTEAEILTQLYAEDGE